MKTAQSQPLCKGISSWRQPDLFRIEKSGISSKAGISHNQSRRVHVFFRKRIPRSRTAGSSRNHRAVLLRKFYTYLKPDQPVQQMVDLTSMSWWFRVRARRTEDPHHHIALALAWTSRTSQPPGAEHCGESNGLVAPAPAPVRILALPGLLHPHHLREAGSHVLHGHAA